MRMCSLPGAELCWTGGTPVAPLFVFRGTIQMCGVFLFAARSTSTALNSAHLPSGEGTGSPTRFSFIMSSKVKGCLACEKAGREESQEKQDGAWRASAEQESVALRTRSEVRGQIAEVKQLRKHRASHKPRSFHLCNLTSNLCNRLTPVLPAWPSSLTARACCRCVLRRRCRPPTFAWPHRRGSLWPALAP